jgi:sulfur-carrier protein
MVQVARILFFGRLADLAGGRERTVNLNGPMEIGAIIAAISADAPDLAEALAKPSVRVAVNRAIAPGRRGRAGPGDEIAFLPPVSGG